MSRTLLIALGLVMWRATSFGQVVYTNHLLIPFLTASSQSNVSVEISDLRRGEVCPLKYTNVVSNTNLFTLDEQALLHDVFTKYSEVKTDCAPAGAVLKKLARTNMVFMGRTNENWMAVFEYTNSAARDNVFFGKHGMSVAHRIKGGNGYNLGMGEVGGGSMLRFNAVRRGRADGLAVDLLNNRVQSYMHYTNGMVIGEFLMWRPSSGRLLIKANFREPYNLDANRKRYNQRF